MNRTITIIINNETKTQEELDIIAKELLNSIEKWVFDDPEINMNRSDYELKVWFDSIY
jgi:hypothetical protein